VNYSYHTHSETNHTISGKTFSVPKMYFQELGLPIKDFIDMTSINRSSATDLVFVTAADDYYLPFATESIATIQHLLPSNQIYFYYLGQRKTVDVAERV